MSGPEAGSQELLKLETAEEARFAASLERGSRGEGREKGNQPNQRSSQLNQCTAEFYLHKTKLDWDTKRCHRDDSLSQQVGNHRDGKLVGQLLHYDFILKTLERHTLLGSCSSFSLLPLSLSKPKE